MKRIAPGILLLAIVAFVRVAPTAQTAAKKVLAPDDYTKWRSISGQEISGDGKWVAYTLQLTNTVPAEAKPVLHILNLDTNDDVSVTNGTGGMFSPDSRWIAYHVDPAPNRRGRGGRAGGGGGSEETPAPPADPGVPPGAPAPPPSTTTAPATPGAQPAPQPAPATQPSAPGAQGTAQPQTPPPPRRVELRNLATGAVRSWDEIDGFVFSPASTHLVLKRRAPEAPGGRGGAANGGAQPPGGGAPAGAGTAASNATAPRGTDVILLDLRSGRYQLLGSVGDIAFNKKGDLLAYTVDAAVKDGNGLFVFDTAGGRTTALDNDAKRYNRLAWSEDGAALAVLKGVDVDKMRERDNVLLAFTDVRAALSGATTTDGDGGASAAPVVLDAKKAAGFPANWVVSDRASLAWSDDDKRVFFGMKEQAATPDTTRRPTDEAADVDIWNSVDERIQSVQMTRAEQDRNFAFREAFDVSASKFVTLADASMRDLDVAQDGKWAVGRDTRGYVSDYKRPAADLYRVNTSTGERTLMAKNQLIGGQVFGISPDGHFYLFWKDNRFQAYDLDAGASRPLGGAGGPNFVDVEFDHPGPKPPFGIVGYAVDGKGVIVEHQYDLWVLPLDGSAARSLTNGAGAKGEIRFRHVRTDAGDPPTSPVAAGPAGGPGAEGFVGGRGRASRERAIDLSKPVLLSAYGEWTKKAGFYEAVNGQLRELTYEDAAFSNPVKAAHADTYLFTRQTFVEFPDLRVSGPDLKNSRKISNANPQQAEYVWGHRVLFDFRNRDGLRLQGILALPDDYKPGEKRPMLVTFYEKNSQNMHRYSAPSYLTGMGASPIEAVSRGYITMMPDVHFRTGSSHSDMLDCVEAATRKVIEMGYADPKRIGIGGHSYGGEGVAYIGTQSKLFAAVAMGAGVTDLFQDFSQNWGWAYDVRGGSGANGNDYYLYGQGRWGKSPWNDPNLYMQESALTHAPKVTAPFLIMHGTSDPTVAFQNGLGFYNALRYNGKTAILLAYPGEGHGLRGMANRKDLTVRFFQFFDHYLKDAPAPAWMTEGVPFLKKNEKEPPAAKPRT